MEFIVCECIDSLLAYYNSWNVYPGLSYIVQACCACLVEGRAKPSERYDIRGESKQHTSC